MPKSTAERGLSSEEWINIAKATLIQEGIAGVKIDRLAKKAGVTRGGFYYRFKSLQGMLDALIDHWRQTNHQPIINTLDGPGSPPERFRALMRLWIEEQDYDPDFDAAVRGWSRVSPNVAKVVHEIDDLRIGALKRLFLDAGYDLDEAFVRARITYFHQVGYYAMGMRESHKRREQLSEFYYRILTGFREGELKHLPPAPKREQAKERKGRTEKPNRRGRADA
ncbi:TetR/AcrR family transcriptional regulator [Sphingomonas sp. ZT3P38]|uniref:TetR/AcrR family transcriptional regulator n=1 Tax=Parasphingomonas zepuensis TaxID=3096161 RepID=UPI002FC7D03A